MHWEAMTLTGWGRLTQASVRACSPRAVAELRLALEAADEGGVLAYGRGRSYGDVALNSGGRSILTTGLDAICDFDPASGAVVCGPGVTFEQLLNEFLPRGYSVPVSPGTAFVTVGGAVANDVHGKNHDRCGSFGDHVRWIDLLLPSGELTRIAPEQNAELFAATVGGIGLTGIMTAVCFTMQRVRSNAIETRERRIADIDEFLARLEEVRGTATYSVGWVDVLARGRNLGRGILMTGEPAAVDVAPRLPRRVRVGVDFPEFTLNRWSIRAFNELYYRRVPAGGRERRVELRRFLYPLDAVLEWNRIYGRAGFYQFQCVLPDASSRVGIRGLLEEISRSRLGSFLVVLKTLGSEGRGLLSFPLRGYTLALDFPARSGTRELLARLERIVLDSGGRIYLAKDACMSASAFATMYPKLELFRAVLDKVDPRRRMNSDLARRLGIRRTRRADDTIGNRGAALTG
jgi:decaprenylphospho-beta-D-ribofuranose 2-oxidase